MASSLTAVVALVGGWELAAAVQPGSFDAVTHTISALARYGAPHRWVMTAGLALLGVSHVVTACGLVGVRVAGRAVLAAAGVATVGVAVFAEPAHGSSSIHVAFATVAFVLLALWPATTTARDGVAALRPGVAVPVTLVSSGLLVWVALVPDGGPLGLAERLLAGQQALWPLVVVLFLRRLGH